MKPRFTKRCPVAGKQINELTMATPLWLAAACRRRIISPSIVSASSGWSVQKPVANISGNTATSAFPAKAAIRSSAKRRLASLSAHTMGYCNSATRIQIAIKINNAAKLQKKINSRKLFTEYHIFFCLKMGKIG